MKSVLSGLSSSFQTGGIFVCLLFLSFTSLRADQLDMTNGDRYFGKVTSLNANSIVLQSDILGLVQLPRNKVATILIGTNFVSNNSAPASTHSVAPIILAGKTAPVVTAPNVAPTSLSQIASQTNLIQQVQKQFLSEAGPEANAKFNKLMSGLGSGQMNLDSLRAEAKKAADQLRDLKRGLGENESTPLDGYLSILDQFLNNAPIDASKVPAPPTQNE